MDSVLEDGLLRRIEAHAVDLARGAGAILGRRFRGSLEVEYKDEKRQRDPVTDVDRESQEYLASGIAQAFPEHGVLGEEDSGQGNAPAPDIVWVLDPLDGTRNFMSGMPVYACSIGVLYRGAPVVGAVFLPWPAEGGGVVLHAHRGGGAFMEGERILVAQVTEPNGNRLVALPGYFGAGFRFLGPMRRKVGELRVTGSIAYELALTAMGVLQYSITTGPKLWDVAGGVVLVAEAGGLVLKGRQEAALKVFPSVRWGPFESFRDAWQSGSTTMKELRQWSSPLALGSPDVVRYVTANLRPRWRLKRRLTRLLSARQQRRR